LLDFFRFPLGEIPVDFPQTPAQVLQSVSFAGEERVDILAGDLSDFLKTPSLELVHDKNLPLCIGKFLEGFRELLAQKGSLELYARIASGVRKHLRQIDRPFSCFRLLHGGPVPPVAAPIDDPVARNRVEPCAEMLQRLRDAVTREELVKNVLENIFSLALIAHPPANVGQQ